MPYGRRNLVCGDRLPNGIRKAEKQKERFMQLQIRDLDSAIPAMDRVRLRTREFLPWRKPRPSGDHVLDELERLALLSPHLLADLGFSRDAAASNPHTTVWRRGRLRVAVATSTRSAFASAG